MTAPTPLRELDLTALVLAHGGHRPPADGGAGEMRLLEAAAYIAGEPWSDHPACVCPTLGAFGRALNDRLPADKRQQLKPLLIDMLGTAGDGRMQARAYLAVDWAVRRQLPVWLKLTERIPAEAAQRIEQLAPITDEATARAARQVVTEVREQAREAREAARTDLITRVKGVGGGGVAYVAVVAVVADAYVADAYVADAYVADAYAAAAAARPVDRAQLRRVVREAVKAKLAPTVEQLQDSAIATFTAMVRLGRDTETSEA